MSKYQKGTFIVVPNKEALKGAPSFVQAVFFWICSYADEEGICFPSRTSIAENAGCSVRSVDRAIELLCATGFLEKQTRKDPSNPNRNLTSLYQIMITDGGGAGVALGSAGAARGGSAPVAERTKSTLNSNNLKASPSFVVVSDQPISRPVKKDATAFRLRQKLYDMFEKEYGVHPTITQADYVRVQAALKHLTQKQVVDLVEDAMEGSRPPKTVREALTDRAIDSYRYEHA